MKAVIVGMWGTTTLTLSLLDAENGAVIDTCQGRGVSKMDGEEFEHELFDRIGDWCRLYRVAKIQLCGMVGSTIGWIDAPYLPCPTNIETLSAACVNHIVRDVEVSIVPGLSCENPLGQLDFLRGEETELLGWLGQVPPDEGRERLVCIPGTHSKWVWVEGSTIKRFMSGVVGEVFDVLVGNGVLATQDADGSSGSSPSFLDAVKDLKRSPHNLVSLLFSVRSRTVAGVQTQSEALDRLSGLLIGADIDSVLSLVEAPHSLPTITIIGRAELAERYARALALWGVSTELIDAHDIGVQGLWRIARRRRKDGETL